ncbi:MAG: EAL domain-containing protein [Proteobacteria bacterium]|nr:EAL domain-containing protein [Pseudomonadota bacterium]
MRALTLPLIGGCAFFSLCIASGSFFLLQTSPLEALALGGVFMVVSIFTFDAHIRSRQQAHITKALGDFYHLQEALVDKLSVLEEQSSDTDTGTKEIISEIKLLHSLVNHIMDEERAAPDQNHVIPVQVYSPEESGHGDILTPSGQTVTNTNYSADQLLKIIKEALQEDRIDMLMQPIVSLPQRKVRAFECYSRLRDELGQVVVPDHYLEIASQQDFIRIIDNSLLFRCVQLVRKALKKDLSVKFFCNLSLATLRDKMFLESFIEFLASNTALAPSILFEIEYADLVGGDEPTQKALSRLAAQGCHFSVDHVSTLEDIDFAFLKKSAVKYLKVDIHLMIAALHTPQKHACVKSFKDKAVRHGMDVIVTKIENEKDLIEILEFQFDFGQGFLFGKPRLYRG